MYVLNTFVTLLFKFNLQNTHPANVLTIMVS